MGPQRVYVRAAWVSQDLRRRSQKAHCHIDVKILHFFCRVCCAEVESRTGLGYRQDIESGYVKAEILRSPVHLFVDSRPSPQCGLCSQPLRPGNLPLR